MPKGVVLAQWALESRWGMSALGASNYFGHTFLAVKRFMAEPSFVSVREKVMRGGRMVLGDTVRFARYRNMAECFSVHGRYVSQSGMYASAFKTRSPEDFARELAKRYATDPSYAIKLIVIMRRYGL
jgi:flagellum-specific peptidoglycan hydrolase FlgJ